MRTDKAGCSFIVQGSHDAKLYPLHVNFLVQGNFLVYLCIPSLFFLWQKWDSYKTIYFLYKEGFILIQAHSILL